MGTHCRMRRLRALIAALLLSLTAVTAACSAEGDVDTGGDGVKVEGDVDSKNNDNDNP